MNRSSSAKVLLVLLHCAYNVSSDHRFSAESHIALTAGLKIEDPFLVELAVCQKSAAHYDTTHESRDNGERREARCVVSSVGFAVSELLPVYHVYSSCTVYNIT